MYTVICSDTMSRNLMCVGDTWRNVYYVRHRKRAIPIFQLKKLRSQHMSWSGFVFIEETLKMCSLLTVLLRQ